MSEINVINITKIEQVRELPKSELACYSLHNDTLETIIEKYERNYRHPPSKGYRWADYVYLEVT